jgi:hypothetical protein
MVRVMGGLHLSVVIIIIIIIIVIFDRGIYVEVQGTKPERRRIERAAFLPDADAKNPSQRLACRTNSGEGGMKKNEVSSLTETRGRRRRRGR